MPHTLYESSRIVANPNFAGTLVNTTANGTSIGTALLGDYEYHAFVYAGTIANTGTVFLYALGATNALIGSFILGSSNSEFVWEVKSDAIVYKGTGYTAIGVNIAVDTGGTWRGAGFWISRWARSAGTSDPTANGWGSVGTTLF